MLFYTKNGSIIDNTKGIIHKQITTAVMICFLRLFLRSFRSSFSLFDNFFALLISPTSLGYFVSFYFGAFDYTLSFYFKKKRRSFDLSLKRKCRFF